MKDPVRSLKRAVRRARNGVTAISRRVGKVVAVVREVLNSIRERHPTLLTEIAALVLQQLIVVVIERTIAWLVRKAAVRPAPARVVPFPTLRPAT